MRKKIKAPSICSPLLSERRKHQFWESAEPKHRRPKSFGSAEASANSFCRYSCYPIAYNTKLLGYFFKKCIFWKIFFSAKGLENDCFGKSTYSVFLNEQKNLAKIQNLSKIFNLGASVEALFLQNRRSRSFGCSVLYVLCSQD